MSGFDWDNMSVEQRARHILSDWQASRDTDDPMVLRVAAAVSHSVLKEALGEIERLRADLAAAIKQRDEATAWRPIETAPMDGTVVLLYGDGRVTAGRWIREREVMASTYHHTTGAYFGSFPSREIYPAYWESHDGGFTEEHPPTHWMPLPQPPREKERGGA